MGRTEVTFVRRGGGDLARASVAALVLGALAACGPDSPNRAGPCDGKNRPAFRVSFVTEAPSLPADLIIRVRYSGGLEEYALADPDPSPSVIFCDHAVADAGGPRGGSDGGTGAFGGGAGTSGDGDGSRAIACDLWTNGAASLVVTGTGFRTVEQSLDADFDEECDEVVTKDVTVEVVPR